MICLCPSLHSSGTQVWVWWASHMLHCFPLSLFILLNCSSLNPPGLSHKIESSGRSEKRPNAHSYISSIKPRAWNLYNYLCENEYMRGWMSKWGRQEWWQRRHEKLQWIFQGILWEREKQIRQSRSISLEPEFQEGQTRGNKALIDYDEFHKRRKQVMWQEVA